MLVKAGDRKPFSISGKTINGINFTFDLTHTTANTSFGGQIMNPLLTTIKVVLYRFGKQYTLVNDNLAAICMDSTLRNSLWLYAQGQAYQTLVAAASGIKQEVSIPLFLDLGGVINLIGQDQITVEFSMPTTCFSSAVDTSTSSCEVQENECFGIETYTPYIFTKTIDQSVSSYNDSYRDRILSLSFINLDKTAILSSSMVCSNAVVNSNCVGLSDSYNQLLQKRQNMLSYQVNPDDRYQSFNILPFYGGMHEGVKVNLMFTTTNVNASKNFVVVRSAYTDERLIQQARVSANAYNNSILL